MAMSESSSSSGGISFAGLLGIVFIVLKLTHVIDWSWWWVTAPLWGGIAVAILVIGVILFGAAIVTGVVAIVAYVLGRDA